MSKWKMHYVDSQGDQISLDSQVDFTTLIETSEKDYIKIYVQDKEPQQQIQISDEDQQTTQVISKVDKNQPTQTKNIQPQQIKPLVQENFDVTTFSVPSLPAIDLNSISKTDIIPNQDQQNKEKCFEGFEKHREQWKKKVQEKMAKFFDERLEAMMPCIIKKVEEQIKNQKPKQLKKSGIQHNVKCNGCGIQPIIGICYRSTKITSFNLCENCQNEIQHEYNMIKMKKPQEQIKQQSNDDQFGRMWWKKHWNQINPKQCEGKQGQQCRGRWGNWDPRIALTKKCFKLCSHFGGEPQDYIKLVEENPKAKRCQLVKIYLESHPDKKVQSEFNQKSKEKVQKLNFYFNDKNFDFTNVVKNNPVSNLKQLINIVRETKLLQNKPQTKVQQIEQVQEIKEQKFIVPQQILISPEKIKPEASSLDSAAKVKKRNDFVLQMKEYFGADNVMQYIDFFNKWSDLGLQEITQKYIDTTYQ